MAQACSRIVGNTLSSSSDELTAWLTFPSDSSSSTERASSRLLACSASNSRVFSMAAVGIKTRVRTMERAAFYSALATKKLRGLCMCVNAVYGNAASRLSEIVPSDGAYAYGGYPDIDALYKEQARESDRAKREAQLHQIQRLLHERVRFGPIFDYIWPSAMGPRVADPALMLIDPYPWSAPLEDVRLKSKWWSMLPARWRSGPFGAATMPSVFE